ncbi:MAG: hypothetical protein ABEI96_07100 [Haloarculaceae archaeon]
MAVSVFQGPFPGFISRIYFQGPFPGFHFRGYYTVNDGVDFVRSRNPLSVDGASGGTISQHPASKGGVELAIDGAGTYADCGFYVASGKLGDVDTIEVTTRDGSDAVGLNLYFDVDDDGDFFAWERGKGNDATFTDVGGDEYVLGDVSGAPGGGSFTVDDGTEFFDGSTNAGHTPFADLKSGAISGIDGETAVAVWVDITAGNGGSKHAIVDAVDVTTT